MLKTLFTAMPEATLVVDATGVIRLANRRAEELFAYAPDALIGRSVDTLAPDAMAAGHILLPFTSCAPAEPIGQELLAIVREAASAATGGAEEVTARIGVAPLGDAPDEPVAAIAAADAAMYEGQARGRRRRSPRGDPRAHLTPSHEEQLDGGSVASTTSSAP